MHPHPQDGSPGRFSDAGCVANHLGLVGIRTCGKYNMIWLVARQPNIWIHTCPILHEYTNVQWHAPPDRIYTSVHLLHFISVGMRRVFKGLSNFKWLLGSHFVFWVQFWVINTKNWGCHAVNLNSASLNCVKSTAWQTLLQNVLTY